MRTDAFLIITPGFAASAEDSDCLPMHQRFVLALQEALPSSQVIILALHYPFQKESYNWNDMTVVPCNGRNRGGVHRLLMLRRARLKLKQVLEKFEVRGVLSFWYGDAAGLGQWLYHKKNIPHYCWILGQDALPSNHHPYRTRIPASQLVALSDALSDTFEKSHGLRPAHVIPPGMDPGITRDVTRDVHILGAGSLIPLKQLDIFIDVVASLQSKFNIRAVLIGEGPEREKIAEEIRSKKLGTSITMTGKLPHAEVLHYMQSSRVLLHPSSYEGFPGVCQEALAAGAHVVSFVQPMHTSIPHWHVVASKQEMIEKVAEILMLDEKEFTPVTIRSMKETVADMKRLFNLHG